MQEITLLPNWAKSLQKAIPIPGADLQSEPERPCERLYWTDSWPCCSIGLIEAVAREIGLWESGSKGKSKNGVWVGEG